MIDGPHDYGGEIGFGPIAPEADEPIFHSEWEKQVLAMTIAMGFTGLWNLDQMRHARESIGFANYRSFSYYRIWLQALINMLVKNGAVTEKEIAAREIRQPPVDLSRKLLADITSDVLCKGGPVDRQIANPAKFVTGDRVTIRSEQPTGHTRMPGYLCGCQGTINGIHGAHVFPDSNARGDGEAPQWLYSVRFEAKALWGEDANCEDAVYADCWEPYFAGA